MDTKQSKFINFIEQQDFDKAAYFLSTLSPQEISDFLQKMHEAISFKVHSVSVLKRQLKPNHSYNDFHKAWLPPLDQKDITSTPTGVSAHYFPFSVRVINAVNIKNPTEIISIGLMGASKQDLETLQSNTNAASAQTLKTEATRHTEIEKVSIKVAETEFFECKDDNILG